MSAQAGFTNQRFREQEEASVLLEAVEESLYRGDVDEALSLVHAMQRRFASSMTETTQLPGLTRREAAALALLPDASLSQKDMARVLGVSLNTLKTHLRSLYQKLGVHSRGEAIERTWGISRCDAAAAPRHLVAV